MCEQYILSGMRGGGCGLGTRLRYPHLLDDVFVHVMYDGRVTVTGTVVGSALPSNPPVALCML